MNRCLSSVLLVISVACCIFPNALSFSLVTLPCRASQELYSSSDDFASFAASLEGERDKGKKQSFPSRTVSVTEKNRSWQEDLDELLDPKTSLARKQILLSDLLNANTDIRAAIEAALRDRRIDPLLTPTGKKLQDGTRAVARQLTNDILPSLTTGEAPLPFSLFPPPRDVQKLGTRLLETIQTQLSAVQEQITQDLQDPVTRIPARVSQQTEEILQEASNVFAETPVGLREPQYKIVYKTDDYEIRDYAGYTVASTNILVEEEYYAPDQRNLGPTSAAFNSLATYLFGANAEKKSMTMTTPVTTTMSGEMRFYLDTESPPNPLDKSKNVYETGTIIIQEIPPARLAVRRFTGFVTKGEITRQKQTLLTALKFDGLFELDVDHGQTVGHLVFQYNPPYALPVIRRNEIAVPILREADTLQENWMDETAP